MDKKLFKPSKKKRETLRAQIQKWKEEAEEQLKMRQEVAIIVARMNGISVKNK